MSRIENILGPSRFQQGVEACATVCLRDCTNEFDATLHILHAAENPYGAGGSTWSSTCLRQTSSSKSSRRRASGSKSLLAREEQAQ